MSSILTTVKKALGITESLEVYDAEIVMHINAVLANLNQIGVGPEQGFQIEDKNNTWESFLDDDPRLNNVKTYLYGKVRLIFDPPPTSFAIEAQERILKELETRIYLAREAEQWNEQSPTVIQVRM